MKKTAAILFLLICAMFTLCACQKEADMVEDMVSTVFSEDRTENNNNSGMNQNNNNSGMNQNDNNSGMNQNNNGENGDNGTITDTDGIIGNEDNTTVGENSGRSNSDSVM